ncbi:MAG: imidazoleglycerol-phosphate dehydratase HisB [Myxococcota bacterium]|nr:imidazoleglycerol-phosphate dehydratase HisB [Myxococcota bacterium]
MPQRRQHQLNRKTLETNITVDLDIDGDGSSQINTGVGFLDHMLSSLTKHAGWTLALACEGDLYIDDHHTAEDCALALGDCLNKILGERKGIQRFGHAYVPLDEALVRAVVDLSGRPWPAVNLHFNRPQIGQLATENIVHFFQSFAVSLKAAVHIDEIKGDNDHHKAEAAFKAFARALKEALKTTGSEAIPSTKGRLG